MGFDPRRLAEIIVTERSGPGRRGTGYRVTGTYILTAAHVVIGDGEIITRFDADRATEWTANAELTWYDTAADLAVLTIDAPASDPLSPTRYGRLDDVGDFIDAHTPGFPRWKLRPARYQGDVFNVRDLHHASARIAVASNRRTGRLEVKVSGPRDTPDTSGSPWEGMSGSPLWAGEHLVGVIAEHHRVEGPDWLTAARLDHCLETTDEPEVLAGLLGLPAGRPELDSLTATVPDPVTVHTVLPSIPEFTGRAEEIAAVVAAAEPGRVVTIHAIDGMPGVGKTALATQLWHLLADRFPQRLFVDLHAHTPGARVVQPADALAGLLIAVGVPPTDLPESLESRMAMWRKRMADRNALIVFDNAANSGQVNPLLPAAPNCLVLLTSRRHLGDLASTPVGVPLKELPPHEAAQLFVRLVPTSADSPAEVAELVSLCGYLPLAIRILARLLTKHHRWTVRNLITMTRAKLLITRAEYETIATVFDLSYQHLSSAEQRLFRCLGLHPGVEFDAYAAAALAGLSTDEAEEQLEDLYGDHLLEEVGDDHGSPRGAAQSRYRMHDLIAQYARGLAEAEPAAHRAEIVDRLVNYYRHAAAAAARQLARRTRPLHGQADEPRVPLPDLSSYQLAAAWLRTEHANLLATVRHLQEHHQPEALAHLASSLAVLPRVDGPWPQAISLQHQALAALRDLDDVLGQAGVLADLGWLLFVVGDCARAAGILDRALEIYAEYGDQLGQGNVLNEIAVLRHLTDDYPGAEQAIDRALALHREVGDRLGQANAHLELGTLRFRVGDYQTAIENLRLALETYRVLDNPLGQANTLTQVGRLWRLIENNGPAAQALNQALRLYENLGNRHGQAHASHELGRLHCLTGDLDQAGPALQLALEVCLDTGDRGGEAEVLNSIGDLELARGDSVVSRQRHEQARLLSWEIESEWDVASALAGLGRCDLADGDEEAALRNLGAALAIFERLGAAEAAKIAAEIAALT
ncbi:tetratricopeptide repeat protein [Actinoplanes regularis]|uniref:tetratricopeptide repeat protein n=1 Tax=Actinoplanes regularis TaxID=52697 RepID=UPI0024A31E59|nr:tetratricopeptide repeat protein [Actinoplanes regularis]GLW33784.1 ATPase [Actinoplanes regularis]